MPLLHENQFEYDLMDVSGGISGITGRAFIHIDVPELSTNGV